MVLFACLGKEAFSCTSCVWSYSLLNGMCNSDCFVGEYKVQETPGQKVATSRTFVQNTNSTWLFSEFLMVPIFKYAYFFPLLAGEALFFFLGFPYSQQRYQNHMNKPLLLMIVFFSSNITDFLLDFWCLFYKKSFCIFDWQLFWKKALVEGQAEINTAVYLIE